MSMKNSSTLIYKDLESGRCHYYYCIIKAFQRIFLFAIIEQDIIAVLKSEQLRAELELGAQSMEFCRCLGDCYSKLLEVPNSLVGNTTCESVTPFFADLQAGASDSSINSSKWQWPEMCCFVS